MNLIIGSVSLNNRIFTHAAIKNVLLEFIKMWYVKERVIADERNPRLRGWGKPPCTPPEKVPDWPNREHLVPRKWRNNSDPDRNFTIISGRLIFDETVCVAQEPVRGGCPRKTIILQYPPICAQLFTYYPAINQACDLLRNTRTLATCRSDPRGGSLLWQTQLIALYRSFHP